MKTDINKASLVEEFFALRGGYRTAAVQRLLNKLEKFVPHIDFDKDLENIRTVLKVWSVGNAKLSKKLSECKEIAEPIFAHMRETSEWSFLDITILSYVIRYSEAIEETIEMVDKALHILDTQYTQEKEYWEVKWVIQCNLIPRIVQARYFDKGENKPEADMDMLKEALERYSSYVLKVAKDYKLTDAEYMTLFRMAIFEGCYRQTESVLGDIDVIDRREFKGLYQAALDELKLYHRLLGQGLSKPLLWRITGWNVRTAREEAGMTMKALAGLVGIDPTYLAHMERGTKGFRCLDLYLIAHILKRDISFFFYGEGLAPEDAPQTEADKRIFDALKGFTEAEKVSLAEFLEAAKAKK